jgi:aspartyl protease family protein
LYAVLYGAAVAASAPIEVVALFKNRAVVKTPSGQELLSIGESSRDGVTLLAADQYGAKVRYANETHDLKLSTKVGSRFMEVESKSIQISQDPRGQYRVRGAINDNYVNFLVDTGASVVAMSGAQARRMGLAYENGRPGRVQTAQGHAKAFFLTLDKVTVGEIDVHGVDATVIDGEYPVDVLLGMSFLNQTKLQDDRGVLTLTANF